MSAPCVSAATMASDAAGGNLITKVWVQVNVLTGIPLWRYMSGKRFSLAGRQATPAVWAGPGPDQ